MEGKGKEILREKEKKGRRNLRYGIKLKLKLNHRKKFSNFSNPDNFSVYMLIMVWPYFLNKYLSQAKCTQNRQRVHQKGKGRKGKINEWKATEIKGQYVYIVCSQFCKK